MPEYNVLPVNKENIKQTPDRFAIDIEGDEFIFEIMWNPDSEIFTFNMYDENESPIILGRRIVYGSNMLENIVDERIPDVIIYPGDRSGEAEKAGITFKNFIDKVRLAVIPNE